MAELFPSDSERARNAQMNTLMLRGRERGEFATGGVAVLSGVPEQAARLTAALDNLDRAKARGDEDDIAYAEYQLDKVVSDARQLRAERDQPRDPASGRFVSSPTSGTDDADVPPPSFDGGVRGRRPFQPGYTEEAATQLFARAMVQSRIERAERGDDDELIARNI